MSSLIARKLAKRPTWLPRGVLERIDARAGRYFAKQAVRKTLAELFAAGSWSYGRADPAMQFDSSGALVSVAADAPRLDYHPATLAPLGLLLERAKTEKLTSGSDLSAWTKVNATVAADADTDPLGGTTADRFVPNSGTSSNVYINRSGGAVVSGQPYTISAFMKSPAGNLNYAALSQFYSAIQHGNWFNTTSGAPGAGGGRSRAAPNGYRRISSTHSPTVTSVNIALFGSTSDGNPSVTGDGAKFIDFWDVTFEAGRFATSPTLGANRARDILSRAAVDATGPFVRVIGFTAPPGADTANVIWQHDDGSEGNRERLYRDVSGVVHFVVTSASGAVFDWTLGTVSDETFNRVSISHDGFRYRAVMNANPTVQSAISPRPTITTERLGSSATVGEEFCGWLGEFMTYRSLAEGGLREASRVFPYWVPTDSANKPFDLFLDLKNGRFWGDGVQYPTFETFLAAYGGTLAGDGSWSIPWTDPSVAVFVEFLVGQAKNAGHNYTLLAIENSSGAAYQKLYLGSGVNSPGSRVFSGANQFFQETSVLDLNMTARIATNWQASAFSVSLNGGTPVTASSGAVISTPATLRVGNNLAGTEGLDNGAIWKIGINRSNMSSSEIQAIANANFQVICGGDSYNGPTAGGGLQSSFSRLTGRMANNVGIGGSTLSSQTGWLLSAIAAYPSAGVLWWDGQPNGYAATVADDIALMVSVANAVLATHSRFIFMCPVPIFDATADVQQRSKDLTAAMLAHPVLGPHSIDALPRLLQLSSAGPQKDAGYPSYDIMLPDKVHLTLAIHDDLFTNLVLPRIVAEAWMLPE